MAEGRQLIKLGHSLVVAVPPVLRQQLALAQGRTVWWHLPWQGEAILTAAPERAGGYPDDRTLYQELATMRRELLRLRARDPARDRAMFAEGYALGRLDGQEMLRDPHGRRSSRIYSRVVAHDVVLGGGRPAAPRSEAGGFDRAELYDPLGPVWGGAVLGEAPN